MKTKEEITKIVKELLAEATEEHKTEAIHYDLEEKERWKVERSHAFVVAYSNILIYLQEE